MKIKKEQIFFVLVALLVIGYLSISLKPFAITEVTCQKNDKLWVRVVVEDLSNVIPECKERNYWNGTMKFYVISPKGNEYELGGYSTSQNSCDYAKQDSAGFAGGTIPNDGTGYYKAQVRGKFYRNGQLYVFTKDLEGKSIGCAPSWQTCSDGTPQGSCSKTKPLYCSEIDLKLIEKPKTCGCPEGKELISGNCFDIITKEQNVCDNGDTRTYKCPDGTLVTKAKCENNKWKNVSYTCPIPTTTETPKSEIKPDSTEKESEIKPDSTEKESEIKPDSTEKEIQWISGIDNTTILLSILFVLVLIGGYIYMRGED